MTMIATAVTTAATFVWLGMILGVSFLETPLKFRAPGVTTAIGLGIGRLVFRALNRIEVLFAAVIVAAVAWDVREISVTVLTVVVVVILIVQLAAIRPRLNRRSEEVLASGTETSRSGGHFSYVALEFAKALALLTLGIEALIAQTTH